MPFPFSRSLIYVFLLSHPITTITISASRRRGDAYNVSHSCGSYSCDGDRTQQPCSCDRLCSEYGDCCPEFPGSAESTRMRINRSLIACSRSQLDPSHYLLVVKCPTNWNDAFVREMCETENLGALPEYLIPVTSNRTAMSYKNAFCAYCNGDAIKDTRFWSFDYKCKKSVLEIEDSRDLFERVANNKCFIHFTDFTRRPCLPQTLGLNSSYDAGGTVGTRGNLIHLCLNYVDYVAVVGEWGIYKNQYCAAHKGLSMDKIVCVNKSLSRYGTRLTSLSALITIAATNEPSISFEKTERNINCHPKELYILHHMECYRVNCPSGYFRSPGGCIPLPKVSLKFVGCSSLQKNGVNDHLKRLAIGIYNLHSSDVCHASEVGDGFLFHKKETQVDLTDMVKTALDLSGEMYRRLIIISDGIQPETSMGMVADCKSATYTGAVATNNVLLVRFMRRMANVTLWPWFVNITSLRLAENKTYMSSVTICRLKVACSYVVLKHRSLPKEITRQSWRYKKGLKFVEVCGDTVREYNDRKREERNREFQSFALRYYHSLTSTGSDNTLFVDMRTLTLLFLCSLHAYIIT